MALLEGVAWEEAINSRRSVRSYDMREVERETMATLKRFEPGLFAPFEHDVTIRFFKATPGRRLYNTMLATPPDGAAFFASTDVRSISASGFVGELFILYATSLGLATCWFGHYSLRELERIMPHLDSEASLPKPAWGYGVGTLPGRRAICITPLGYFQPKGLRLLDRLTQSVMSNRRKPLAALIDGASEESLDPDVLYALDLARKAPSGANSQHWRFLVEPGKHSVSIAMPAGYKHIKWEHPDVDVGACACHFWLGLCLKRISSRVSLSSEEGRAVWRFEIGK